MVQQRHPMTAKLNWVIVHFPKSGDIFDGHDWEGPTGTLMLLSITGNAAKHPAMTRVGPSNPLHSNQDFFGLKC